MRTGGVWVCCVCTSPADDAVVDGDTDETIQLNSGYWR